MLEREIKLAGIHTEEKEERDEGVVDCRSLLE